jgi:hypothetical protein
MTQSIPNAQLPTPKSDRSTELGGKATNGYFGTTFNQLVRTSRWKLGLGSWALAIGS